MGAPRLPTDSCDDDMYLQSHYIEHTPLSSDDSDDEATDAYGNYQTLMMDDTEDLVQLDNNMDSSAADFAADINDLSLTGDSSLPTIQCVEAEIEHQVWREPRPQVLRIELDRSTTEQILNVMANVSLPSINIPDWARSIPEERWKDEFVERIRQRNVV